MNDANNIDTPISGWLEKRKEGEEKGPDQYRELVGSINYLVNLKL